MALVCAPGLDTRAGRIEGRIAREASSGGARAAAVEVRPGRAGLLVAEVFELLRGVPERAELRAPIDSVDQRGLTVLGRRVQLLSGTRIAREVPISPRSSMHRLIAADVSALQPGVQVRVVLQTSDEGDLRAEALHIRADQRREERLLVGPFTLVGPNRKGLARVRMLGLELLVDETARLVGFRRQVRPIVRPRIGAVDGDDLRFHAARRRMGRLALAGELRLKSEGISGPELDVELDDEEIETGLLGIVGLAAELGRVFAYAEAVGEQEYSIRGPDAPSRNNGQARVVEAYVEIAGPPRLAVAVGRQKFNEAREWYYNRNDLDAVRLLLDLQPLSLEVSVGQRVLGDRGDERDDERRNYIGRARLDIGRGQQLEAFYLERVDRGEIGDSPRHLGVRLHGRRGRHLAYWADLAMQRGTRAHLHAATSTVVRRSIRGDALDAGLSYRPRVAWDPSFTLSYAAASGGTDVGLPDEPEQLAATPDRRFSQSGLHRNRGRFNGVVSFRYYGEALDPELTNLHVLTAGIGLRPARSFSLDLIYHRYRQDIPSARLFGSDLDADPLGLDDDLGQEWDLILGFEPGERIELKLTGGRFLPGAAFRDLSRPKPPPFDVARLQLKLRF